jgi:hypothetical protein
MIQREWFCCSGPVTQTHAGMEHEMGSLSEMYVLCWLATFADTIGIHDERNVI